MSQLSAIPEDLRERVGKLYEELTLAKCHSSVVEHLTKEINENWMVACSGGADSILALLITFAAFPSARKNLTVLHLNHQLRGAESDQDSQFVRGIANSLKLSFHSRSAEYSIKSDEGTLRKERIDFFCEAMEKFDGRILIQGHNLDDVAETFLWRIPRGVGLEGLVAPRPIQVHKEFTFVRPLLDLPRHEIRKLLKNYAIPWRDDESNDSNQYLRNRLRKNTLLKWKSDSDRNLLDGVVRTRELIEEQELALGEWAIKAYHECLEGKKLIARKMLQNPRAINRKIITYWLSNDLAQESVRQRNIDHMLNHLSCEGGFKIQISSNLAVQLSKGVFEQCAFVVSSRSWGTLNLVYGAHIYLPAGFSLKAEFIKLDPELRCKILSGIINQDSNAYISKISQVDGLLFRQRNKGDKFTPMGATGSKKVKDSMIDKHWKQSRKNNTPIVTNSENEILWIPGFPPSKFACISGEEEEVIRLTYNKSET
jgi:tRNA(Ile)-lysidine synthase